MNAYLPEVRAQAEATRDAAARDFGDLELDALNWKPSPQAWSVAQCLDHLRIANRAYWPTFDAIAEGRKRTTIAERIPMLPRLFGPLLRRAVSPDTRVRTKTTSDLRPAASDLPASIISDVAANVDAHLAKIDALTAVDHGRIVVTSPFARFVTYTLEDAVRISVAHLERHRRQAVGVTRAPGFLLTVAD